MIPRKPKLDPRTCERLALYSIDELRFWYNQGKAGEALRKGGPTVDELKAELQRRLWREAWVSRLTLLAAVIGAMAAIIAAIEGWPHAK